MQHNPTQLDLVVPCRTLEPYNLRIFWLPLALAKSFLQSVLGVTKQKRFQVLTEVQKQMSSLDAEMKEARKDAEGMQQVPLLVDVRTLFLDCGSWSYSRCVRLCPPVLAEIRC